MAQPLVMYSYLFVYIVSNKVEGDVIAHPLLHWNFMKLTDFFNPPKSQGITNTGIQMIQTRIYLDKNVLINALWLH